MLSARASPNSVPNAPLVMRARAASEPNACATRARQGRGLLSRQASWAVTLAWPGARWMSRGVGLLRTAGQHGQGWMLRAPPSTRQLGWRLAASRPGAFSALHTPPSTAAGPSPTLPAARARQPHLCDALHLPARYVVPRRRAAAAQIKPHVLRRQLRVLGLPSGGEIWPVDRVPIGPRDCAPRVGAGGRAAARGRGRVRGRRGGAGGDDAEGRDLGARGDAVACVTPVYALCGGGRRREGSQPRGPNGFSIQSCHDVPIAL